MIDQLTRGEWCGHQLHAIDHRIEAALEQLDQIVACIAAPPVRFFIKSAELALADIGVIALELLLGGELRSEVGRLLAALAVLAGTVFAAIERALRPAPQIDAEAPINLVLRPVSFAHLVIPSCDFVVPVGPHARTGPSVFAGGPAFPGIRRRTILRTRGKSNAVAGEPIALTSSPSARRTP